MTKPADIEEYISGFSPEIQTRLQRVRKVVKDAAPLAQETISYGIPAFKSNGMLVWFAAHTKHIGFYPRGSGIKEFEKELSGYKTTKGAIQFPFDQPLPLDLITRIVKFRVAENTERLRRTKK